MQTGAGFLACVCAALCTWNVMSVQPSQTKIMGPFLAAFLHRWTKDPCHVVLVDMNKEATLEWADDQFLPAYSPVHLNTSNEDSVEKMRVDLKLTSWCVVAILDSDEGSDKLSVVETTIEVVPQRRMIVWKATRDTDQEFTQTTKEHFQTLLSSHLMIYVWSENGLVHLRRNCSYCPPSNQIVKSIWTSEKGFISGFECCPGRSELHGRTFNVATFGMIPYVHTTIKGGRLVLSGVDADILDIVANRLHFRHTLKFVRGWYYTINGTKHGTVGSVANSQSLMAIGQISMTYPRYQLRTG